MKRNITTPFLLLTLVGTTLLFGFSAPRLDSPGLDSPRQDDPKPGEKKIKWMTIEQAFAENTKTPKKIFIDVYTDWCGWCKVMDQKTFTHPAIIDYINEHYHAVKLNAEQRENITLGLQTFKYVDQGGRGVHELAVALLKGQMSYPTTVFLDEKGQMIQPLPGYLEPRMAHQILTYFGGGHNAKESFDAYKTGTYVKEYQPAMPVPAGQ